MSPTQLTLGLSSIDEERFGIRSARASGLTVEALPGVIEFCQQNDVKFLVARCPVHELPAAQAMEGNGFILMDTFVVFRPTVDECITSTYWGHVANPVCPQS